MVTGVGRCRRIIAVFRRVPSWRRRSPLSRRRGDEGFGMIDCVIAMVVLLAVLIPTGYLFTNVISSSASARERITALSVAEQWIENLNNQGPPSDSDGQPEVGTSITESSSVLSGVTYHVAAEFQWTDSTGGTPDFCSSDTSPVLGLQVTVSWTGNQSITDQAILNFPASGNLTNGYLAVQVNGDPAGSPPVDAFSNSWANRVTSVPIQVSGTNLSTPESINPASTGCAFLSLAPGTYTVQVGPGPTSAYVANYNQASSETQPVASQASIVVIAAEVTSVTFQYDEGTDVGLSYPSSTAVADGLSCPNTGPVICLALGQMPASSTSPAASPEATGIVKTSSGWSVPTFPTTLTEIKGVSCTTSACIAVGYSSSGGAAAVTTNGTTWTTTSLPSGSNVAQLTSIVCPTSATTPACIAIGAGTSSNGVLLTATISGSTVTWTKDTIPTTTALSQIVCPSSSAQPVCFVSGTTSSGATIFSNSGSASPGTTWTTYTTQSGTSMSTVTQVACNSTTFCVAIGTGKTSSSGSVGPLIIQLSSGTWDHYTNSTSLTPTAFTSVACATSGSNCWASGTTSSARFVAYISSGTTWKADSGIPATATAVSGLTCPGSTSGCFALYTTSSSAGVISLSSGTSWSTATLPSGIVALSQLVCPSTSACYASGASSSAAIVDVLKSGSWSSATFTGTTGGNPVYISGLACTAATTCEVAGATESSAEVLDYTSSTTTFSGSGTPTTLSGLYLDNPPIMVSNANMQTSTVIEMAAPTTANGPQTEVGPLFPFSSGYSIAAGYCSSELTTASVSAATTPGATPTTSPAAPTVTLPMGILPIEATTASGAALSGATISIVDDSCTSELTPLSSGSWPALTNPPSSPSNPTSYSMPTSGADGLSELAVIYGTYLVTVTSGGTHATTTVTVNPTSIVVGSTTYYNAASVPIPD